MRNKLRIVASVAVVVAILVLLTTAFLQLSGQAVGAAHATFWSLIPPVVAIVLALMTKEVYSSLFIGIVVGGLLYSGFRFETTVTHIFSDGMISVLSEGWNVGILIFLVVLGAMVCLMNRSGGSAAFGRWAATHIKSRVGSQLVTLLLGCFIFIDDYFNCLTVGSVMRPVTDGHKVSRSKLAYIIDSTAAPICIIAPISSWAAAVAGFVEGEDGLGLFLKSIPFNFYALLTIFFMVVLILLKVDFGPMARHEENAAQGDLHSCSDEDYAIVEGVEDSTRGRVVDMVFPIVSLIVCCVVGIIYTGGFFSGTDFITAFADSNASLGLVLGSFFGLVITLVYYAIRHLMPLREMMECIPEGFKAMVPAILILTFAWTLKAMTDSLGADIFVEGLIRGSAEGFMNLLPAIIFVIACFLAFATGTSWGTFGILIPIVVDAFSGSDYQLMIIAISACMAGAVCGDHCSPISDTTIMASAGAQCNHVNHVSTQLPYSLSVAAVSFVTYIIAGFFRSAPISLVAGMVLIVVMLLIIKAFRTRHN